MDYYGSLFQIHFWGSMTNVRHTTQLETEIRILKEKLDKIDKQLLLKMNSTPTNFEESAVKVFAHYIYELSTGKTLSEQLKEILESELPQTRKVIKDWFDLKRSKS